MPNSQGTWERCREKKFKPNGKDFYSCGKKKGHDGAHADTKFGQYHWEEESDG